MSLEDIRKEYEKLLITQYRIKPKARATIRLLTNQALCEGLPLELARTFDLETAIGAQLDILGRIVGVPRQVYGLDLFHIFFEFCRYNDPTAGIGFGRYLDDPYPTDLFLRYITTAVYSMSDFELRSVIKIKIIQNNNYSSLKDLMGSIFTDFGTEITIADNKNMTIEYDSDIKYRNTVLVCQYLDILPRPMGVETTVVISSFSLSSSSSKSSSSSSSCRSSSSSSRSSSSSCRSSSSSSSSCRSSSSSCSSCSSSSSCRSSSSSSSSSSA